MTDPYLVLPHPEIERVMVQAAEATGRVEIRYRTRVARLLSEGDRVCGAVLAQEHGAEQETRAHLVIGADGAASAVRNGLQIALARTPYNHALFIVDIDRPPNHPDALRTELHPDGGILVVPGADRLGLAALVRREHEHLFRAGSVEAKFAHIENRSPLLSGRRPSPAGVHLYKLWRGHAPRYWAPGAALIGDAIHVINPVMAQGMTMAIEDGAALARHAGPLLAAHADAAALDAALACYEGERRPFNAAVIRRSHWMSVAFSLGGRLGDRLHQAAFRLADSLLGRALQKRIWSQFATSPEGSMHNLNGKEQPSSPGFLNPAPCPRRGPGRGPTSHRDSQLSLPQRFFGSSPLTDRDRITSPLPSAITRSANRNDPWILSKREDLVWFQGSVVAGITLLVLFVILRRFDPSPYKLGAPALMAVFAWGALFDGTHVWGTYARTYFAPQQESRAALPGAWSWALAALGPAVALIAAALGAPVAFNLFVLAAYLWAYWHLVRQHYGFVMLYRRRAGDSDASGARLDGLILWSGCLYPFARFALGDGYRHSGLPQLLAPAMLAPARLALDVAFAITVAIILKVVFTQRIEPLRAGPRHLLMAICDRITHRRLRAARQPAGDPRHPHHLSQSSVPPHRLALRKRSRPQAVGRARAIPHVGAGTRSHLVRSAGDWSGRGALGTPA
jgi:2-polyprenyl-6-methoxyphenol hydroxylase-like FAD-dependent oxidoreductase